MGCHKLRAHTCRLILSEASSTFPIEALLTKILSSVAGGCCTGGMGRSNIFPIPAQQHAATASTMSASTNSPPNSPPAWQLKHRTPSVETQVPHLVQYGMLLLRVAY